MRRAGTRIRVEYLDVRAMLSTCPHARVGFVVPKYGHSSVERNRLKRRLRELVRRRLLPSLRLAVPPTQQIADHCAEPIDDRSATAAATAAATASATAAPVPAAPVPTTPSDGAAASVPPIDVVVRALPAAYAAPFAALAVQIDRVYAGVRQRLVRNDG